MTGVGGRDQTERETHVIAFAKTPGTSKVRSADELLAEFRATGAQASFEELVRRYAAMVFSECYAVTKSRHDAEDAAQATFLTLAVQARTGDEIRHLGPWLQRVARRVALDHEKAKRRRKRREDNHHIVNGSTGVATQHRESLDQLELRHMINEELQQLPAKYRMPLVLHYFGGLTREQMAAELKCKPATLGVRLFRAREMLGKRLAKRGIALPAAALPLGIAMVVRESVEQHGVMAMAATASQIAEAAARISAGLSPHAGTVSSAAIAMADSAAQQLILRKVRAIVAAAAIGASALAAGAAQVVHKITDGSLSIPAMFDVTGYFRSLTSPGLPQLRVDATPQRLDGGAPLPPGWPAALALVGEGSLELSNVSFGGREVRSGVAPPSSAILPPYIGGRTAVPSSTAFPMPPARAASAAATPSSTLDLGPVRLAQGGASHESFAHSANAASNTMLLPSRAARSDNATDESAWTFGYAGGSDRAYYSADLTTLSTLHTGFTSAQGLVLKPVALKSSRTAILGRPGAVEVAGLPGASLDMPAAGSNLNAADVRGPRNAEISSEGNVLRGWGTPAYAGHFDMSGVVIADGYGQPRTLDLSSLSSVANSIHNPPAGINGWYAQRGGRLSLPRLVVSAGESSTVTFGDAPADSDVYGQGRLDLVNSARLTFRSVTIASGKPEASVAVSLLAPDRPEVPTIPAGLSAVTVWELVADAELSFASMDITARYALPDGVSQTSALAGLGVYYFADDAWYRAIASIDTSARVIVASGIPQTSLVALFGGTDFAITGAAGTELVAEIFDLASIDASIHSLSSDLPGEGHGLRADFGPISTGTASSGLSVSAPGGTIVPEPVALTLLLPLGALLTRPRRSPRA